MVGGGGSNERLTTPHGVCGGWISHHVRMLVIRNEGGLGMIIKLYNPCCTNELFKQLSVGCYWYLLTELLYLYLYVGCV